VCVRRGEFDVGPRNLASLIDRLSDSNQQKVVQAGWLQSRARMLILEGPTAGVDISAKLAIHSMLRAAAKTRGVRIGCAALSAHALIEVSSTSQYEAGTPSNLAHSME
jgi:ABC-type sugar transport system ATPase subunit